MATVNFYTPLQQALMGPNPKIKRTRGSVIDPAAGGWGAAANITQDFLDAFEKRRERKDRSDIIAALTGSGKTFQYDPAQAEESFEPSLFLDTQRDAQAVPQATTEESALGLSPEDIPLPFLDSKSENILDRAIPDRADRSRNAEMQANAAMEAALIGNVATPEQELAAYTGSAEDRAIQERAFKENLNTPEAVQARMAALDPRLQENPLYQSWQMGEIAREQALADEQRKHEQAKELKAIAPTTAGAKPGTPYQLGGRLVQDYIDPVTGNWATRDLGKEPPHEYTSRPGVALQYEEALTTLKAEIRAEEARDPNSPQLPILRERLDDLNATIAKSLDYIGSAAYAKTYEGARGTTKEEREKNMRGRRRGIQTKHDRLPILQKNIDEMKTLSEGFFTSGTLGKVAGFFPESDQYELDQRIKNIQSAVGLQELIDVKAQGATFGSLTEQEMELLISSVGNLNTLLDPEVLAESLDDIIRLYAKGLETSKREFGVLYPKADKTWETEENIIKFDAAGNQIK